MSETNDKRDTSNKRTPAQIEADKVFIADKLVMGYSMGKIALLLNEQNEGKYQLSRQQVYNDCKAVMEEWKKERLFKMDYNLDLELRKIDNIEREAMEEWQRSKRQKRKAKIEGGEITPTTPEERGRLKERTVEDMIGNAKFLQIAQWCIDKRAELFGLKTINIKSTSRIDPDQVQTLSKLPKEVINELRKYTT